MGNVVDLGACYLAFHQHYLVSSKDLQELSLLPAKPTEYSTFKAPVGRRSSIL
jgi:hypothetical protein